LQPLVDQARRDMQRYSPERIDTIVGRRLAALPIACGRRRKRKNNARRS
jgi:hypothetical protein